MATSEDQPQQPEQPGQSEPSEPSQEPRQPPRHQSRPLARPLTRRGVQEAHELIKPYIHQTPVITSTTLSSIASQPQTHEALLHSSGTNDPSVEPVNPPRINIFFKCENFQKIGAFKVRGAFHALARLSDAQLAKGVVTHSSGNHAQALALAARTRGVKAYIVMPSISTPSKIAATRAQGADIIFSGSTADEREAVVKEVIERTGAYLVPPYDHPDIVLGQGTLALELEKQVEDLLRSRKNNGSGGAEQQEQQHPHLDAVIAPCGGGGMLAGVATAFSGTGTLVFGAEPSFQGADDATRSLSTGTRIDTVRSLTIADGLRTPLGVIPWSIISNPAKVRGIYSVSEDEIKAAMRLVVERLKVWVEPSAVVGVAVALFDEGFRRVLAEEAERKVKEGRGTGEINLGVVLSGGNTTLEAVGGLFSAAAKATVGRGAEGGKGWKVEREQGVVGKDGKKTAENVAG
ncbi:MAG: hypothetical protein M1819_004768 [Sarea resinae]|nr:MAG: hypothetical protein M1819_004768 [Sarea resinae]